MVIDATAEAAPAPSILNEYQTPDTFDYYVTPDSVDYYQQP